MYSAAKQEFVDRRTRAPLQQRRAMRFAHRLEQPIVLHIAGTDLQHIAVLAHQIDIFRRNDFGHDRQPRLLASLGEHFEANFLETLETVGTGPWLERSAT